MSVQRYAFDVLLDDPALGEKELRVEVRAGDRLKAELEAVKQKVSEPKLYPQHITALWLWCALVRTGDVEVGFQEFKRDLLIEFGRAEEADAAVDPTPAETSASPSPSQPTSEEDRITGSPSTTTGS
jgi:hypothetical protein